jgi:hypothetical protein
VFSESAVASQSPLCTRGLPSDHRTVTNVPAEYNEIPAGASMAQSSRFAFFTNETTASAVATIRQDAEQAGRDPAEVAV